MPSDAWLVYLEMRAATRSLPTIAAQRLLIDRLAELRAEGENVRACIELATMSNWKSFHRPQRSRSIGPAESPRDRHARERVAAMTGGLAAASAPGAEHSVEIVDVDARRVG
jgi:hypothetical protein